MTEATSPREPRLLHAAGLSLTLALYLTFPVWLHPLSGVVGNWQHPDMISNHWLYQWIADQVFGGGSLLHNHRYYLPSGDAPWLAGNGNDAVLHLPLAALLPWPLSVTAWSLITLTLNGLAGWTFCRAWKVDGWGSLLGAALLTLCTYTAGELGAGRFAQAPIYWTGFFLAAWTRQLEDPTWRRGLLAGLLFGGAAFTYPYQGLWAAGAGGLLWLGRPHWRSVLTTAPSALLGCLPLLVWARHWSSVPGTDEPVFPHPIQVDSGYPWTWLFGGAPEPLPAGPVPLVALVLVGLALAQRVGLRRLVPLGGIAAVFYLLALGPVLRTPGGDPTALSAPFAWVYGLAPPLQRFWWPYRQAWMVLLALLPVAGLGLHRLGARLQLPPKRTFALVLGVLLVEGALRGQGAGVPSSLWRPPPVYEQLADKDRGALLELPMATPWTRSQQSLSYQWAHRRDLVNGHAMWVPRVRPDTWDAWVASQPFLRQLSQLDLGRLDGAFRVAPGDLEQLQAAGIALISVNAEYYQGPLLELVPVHRRLLTALFGPPVVRQDEFLQVWELDRWTGLEVVDLPDFRVPIAPEGEDPSDLALRPDMALGWTTLPRLAIAVPEPGGDAGREEERPPEPVVREPEPDDGVPDAVRRARRRQKGRNLQRGAPE